MRSLCTKASVPAVLLAAGLLAGCTSPCCRAPDGDMRPIAPAAVVPPSAPLQKLTVSNHTNRDVNAVGTNVSTLPLPSSNPMSYDLNMGDLDSVYAGLEGYPADQSNVPDLKKVVRIDLFIEGGSLRTTFTYQ